jgi:hypothetical protein
MLQQQKRINKCLGRIQCDRTPSPPSGSSTLRIHPHRFPRLFIHVNYLKLAVTLACQLFSLGIDLVIAFWHGSSWIPRGDTVGHGGTWLSCATLYKFMTQLLRE